MRDADIKAKGRRKEVLVPEEQHSAWGGCTAVVRGQRMVRSPQAKPGKMGDNRGAGRRLDGGGGGVLRKLGRGFEGRLPEQVSDSLGRVGTVWQPHVGCPEHSRREQIPSGWNQALLGKCHL